MNLPATSTVCVEKPFAETAYAGIDPLPKKAIVRVEDFKGLDQFGRPKGTLSESSGIPLRELVRSLLQMSPNGKPHQPNSIEIAR